MKTSRPTVGDHQAPNVQTSGPSLVRAWIGRLLTVFFLVSLAGFGLILAGTLTLASVDVITPDPWDGLQMAIGWISTLLLGCLSLGVGARIFSRRLLFGMVTAGIACGCSLVIAELAIRLLIPGWPAMGLHGADLQKWQTSGPLDESGKSNVTTSEWNSWGQRDREHAISPEQNTYRVALVGDSFLEESEGPPLAIRLEALLKEANVEVLNLGVSATSPDEYFYRVKNIAIPLGVQHCVLCLFAGNDLIGPVRSLESYLGVAAVYPRDSFLSKMGFLGVNHLFTNNQRPVMQAWFQSGDRWQQEQKLHERLSKADDEAAAAILLEMTKGQLDAPNRRALEKRLQQPKMTAFYEMLRHPDAGRFRSYYLAPALGAASTNGHGRWDPISEENAWYWVAQTQNICKTNGVDFTLVIIPEAFQVDPKMRDDWLPLADMQNVTQECRPPAVRIARRGEEAGWNVVDLHQSLEEKGGCYLNMDGHWSDTGTKQVAQVLSEELKLPRKTVDAEREPRSKD